MILEPLKALVAQGNYRRLENRDVHKMLFSRSKDQRCDREAYQNNQAHLPTLHVRMNDITKRLKTISRDYEQIDIKAKELRAQLMFLSIQQKVNIQ